MNIDGRCWTGGAEIGCGLSSLRDSRAELKVPGRILEVLLVGSS